MKKKKLPQEYCVLDFECFSEANLKKVGSYEYSMHESTDILCVAWRTGTRETLLKNPVQSWTPMFDGTQIRGPLMELGQILSNSKYKIVAHNAIFERFIVRNVLRRLYLTGIPLVPLNRWACTAALAGTMALPRKLEGACKVLDLPAKKDMTGHRLMLKHSKPRKPTKNDPSTRHTDLEERKRILEYCIGDIDAETHLFLTVPPLNKFERQVWLLDQKLNERGFMVDRETVQTCIRLVGEEHATLQRWIQKATKGRVKSTNQRDKILEFLEENDCFIPDLREKTVKDALDTKLATGVAAKVLRYRQRGSRTSNKKYWALEARSRVDGRIRDWAMYHGASTGRWTGAGIQPHNFPRGTIKDSNQATKILAKGDLEEIRMIYGDPGKALASCLRNMIIPSPGKTFHVADYAAIEARVLFWVAKHKDGVAAFREGRDLYIEQAAYAFGLDANDIQKDSFERFIGKGLILGCGYGMGFKKFTATCKQQGKDVDEGLAKNAVGAYRELHWPVPQLWKKLEMAAIAAVDNVGKRYEINRTKWWVSGRSLWCELPSGRRLAYIDPTVEWEKPVWGGDKVPVLYHWGIDKHHWAKQKTWGGTLTENVVQAISRDLLAAALLRIEAAGPWEIAFHVHDEAAAEHDARKGGTIQEFCKLMEELPDWGRGIPVKAEGWEGGRYRK